MSITKQGIIALMVTFNVIHVATAQTLAEKADKQYELHAYRLAAQSYESLLAQGSDEWNAAAKLADCYLHMSEFAKAATFYARSIQNKNAKDADYLQYGRILMMLGQYDEAEKQFTVFQKTNLIAGTHFIKAAKFARESDEKATDYQISLSKTSSTAADFTPTTFKDYIIWSSTRTDLKRVANTTGAKNGLTGSLSNQLYAAPIEGLSNVAFNVKFLKNDFKNTYNESQPSYTADGKTVAFMRNNFVDRDRIMSAGGLELSLYTATVDDEGNWIDIKAFPYNNGSTGFPCLSADGNTLYFASTRSGGQGGFDLYSAVKRGNVWGEPRNLGDKINTAGDEITPFIHDKTLYFASDWHIGYGGFDVFKTEGATGDIINLGTRVNSSGDDFGFVLTPAGNVGFFTSNRQGGKGNYDIYRADATANERVNLVVLDKMTRKVMTDVEVKVTSGNAQNLTATRGGGYFANVSDGKNLTIEIKKDGFKTKIHTIEPQFVPSTRVIEINLEKNIPTQMSTNAMPEYSGMVTDASTGEPLENVVVRLTDQTTESQTDMMTDVKGKYRVPLNVNSNYVFSFSKEGFVVTQKLVKAADFKTKYMGETVLKHTDISDKTNTYTASTTSNTDKKSLPKDDARPLTDYNTQAMPKQNPRSGGTSTPSVIESSTVIQSVKGEPVYAVQLAVSGKQEVLSLSKYDDLRKLGNIYVVSEADLQKTRIGIFKTREEADATVREAAKLKYKGIFVVIEKNAAAVSENMFKVIPKPITKNTPKDYNKIVTPQPKAVEDKTFKVKLAAMKNPSLFDDSKVSKLWKIDHVKEGDFTIFIMDGFKTLKEAIDMKKKVQTTSPFKDAKVVVKEGDKFKVVD